MDGLELGSGQNLRVGGGKDFGAPTTPTYFYFFADHPPHIFNFFHSGPPLMISTGTAKEFLNHKCQWFFPIPYFTSTCGRESPKPDLHFLYTPNKKSLNG